MKATPYRWLHCATIHTSSSRFSSLRENAARRPMAQLLSFPSVFPGRPLRVPPWKGPTRVVSMVSVSGQQAKVCRVTAAKETTESAQASEDLAANGTSRRATLTLLGSLLAETMCAPQSRAESLAVLEGADPSATVFPEQLVVSAVPVSDVQSIQSENVSQTDDLSADVLTVEPRALEGSETGSSEAEIATPSPPVNEKQAASFSLQNDLINACSYAYPVTLNADSSPLQWIVTRQPERYSSAAPLSPDARLRIVSERLLISETVAVTVAIAPPNEAFLTSPPPSKQGGPASASDWTAKNVALSILADRISPRLSPEQRQQEATLVDAFTETRQGPVRLAGVEGPPSPAAPYYVFEFLTQKSPTLSRLNSTGPVLRRSLSVAAEREGYIYVLTVSALDDKWGTFGPVLEEVAKSFRLDDTTSNYIPPWKDPWRFW